jgi:predicted metal-dependent hydrolase
MANTRYYYRYMDEKSPLIVCFVADLMFSTRIDNAIRHLGCQSKWIERAAQLGEARADTTPDAPGEALRGRSGELFTRLTAWQPALLLFDLANENIPWQRWIPALKSSPATRRMPILCFGPHADVAVMSEAKRIGADVVLARSRFTADIPGLLQQHMRLPDHEAIDKACQEPLLEAAIEGLELHNRGEYFEAHEALELAWNQDTGPGRDLYRGLVQVTVTYLQIERGNYRGAVKMCLRLHQWLDPLPAQCRGVDVGQLRDQTRSLHEPQLELGPEKLGELDPSLLAPIQYTIP